jgi:hypothetical protein
MILAPLLLAAAAAAPAAPVTLIKVGRLID